MALMKDAKTFGVAWLGDKAPMKLMPLLNMPALCREEPPDVISNFNCTDHMSEGGEGHTIHQAVIQGQSC